MAEQGAAMHAAQAVKQLLIAHVEVERAGKAEDKLANVEAQAKLNRQANRQWLHHVDHQWNRGAGVKLSDFLPARRLSALGVGQKRFFVEMDCPVTQQKRKRSCIEDTVSGQRYLEVPLRVVDGLRQPRPTWHVCQDQGTLGWPALAWYIYKAGARGTQLWDRFHRCANDRIDGLSEAGLTSVRLEWAPVLSLRSGRPFKKAAHHHTLREAARDMFDKLDSSSAIFAHLYSDICHDLDVLSEPGFGTADHMSSVWKRLESLLCSAGKGEICKISRWWSWEARAEQLVPGNGGIHCLYMLLIWVGYRKGWWATYDKCPLSSQFDFQEAMQADDGDGQAGGEAAGIAEPGSQAAEAVAQPACAPGTPAAQRQSIARGREQLAKHRSRLGNTMLYSVRLLSNPLAVRLLRGLCLLPKALHESYSEGHQAFQTQLGTLHLHQRLQAGSYNEVLHAMLATLTSATFAARLV